MNSNYVQCKIKVSETWTDCAVGLATVADGSKARNIRHRLGSRRLVICASLSTGNGLASSTRRAVMIYVIRQTRRCCCNFLPLPLHLLCCRSTSPIDKCATFCAIKEKIFRAINHQRRRSWKRRREEPGAESKNSFVPSRSREREREREHSTKATTTTKMLLAAAAASGKSLYQFGHSANDNQSQYWNGTKGLRWRYPLVQCIIIRR